MAISDELQKLEEMHRTGALSDDEYTKAKAAVLAGSVQVAAAGAPGAAGPQAVSKEVLTRQWAMFLHLSILAGFLIPIAGLVVPIVIWQLKKEELPGLDPHGKMILNWIVSLVIYGIVCTLLVVVLIGIPLLFALGLVALIFPIIGAIKANEGVLWKYPMTITFLS